MSLTPWDVVIIVAFLLFYLFVGFYFKKKAEKNTETFFLGGRNLPWWLAGTSMVATTFAADTPLAVTELVAGNGIAGNWLWWNMMAGGMFTTFFFAKYWRRAQILTDVEFIQLRYSGKEAGFLRNFKAVYLGLLLNCIIIGWVNIALMSLIKVFFGIEGPLLLLLVGLCMLFVALYSSLSGLIGVIYTDFVQFIAAMTGSIVLAFLVLHSERVGGIASLKASLPEGTLSFFPDILAYERGSSDLKTLSLGVGSFLAYIGFQWWASWYPGNEPGGGGYIAQRMMSTRDERSAVYATLFFQIAHYCLRPWPWIIVGLCSVILYPELSAQDSKLGYVMAMKEFLPAGLKGLLLAAFLSAYMSTISTQLNWGASYLINDLFLPLNKRIKSERDRIAVSRWVIFFIMIVSLVITSRIETISGVWRFLIEAGAGLGLVLIIRWFWWRVNAWSEIVATIAPMFAYLISYHLLEWEFPNTFFFSVAFTTVAWVTATYATTTTRLETLKVFYERIKPAGNWKPFTKQNPENRKIPALLTCWLSAIGIGYSILFLIGNLILTNWQNVLANTLILIFALLLLRKAATYSDIFK